MGRQNCVVSDLLTLHQELLRFSVAKSDKKHKFWIGIHLPVFFSKNIFHIMMEKERPTTFLDPLTTKYTWNSNKWMKYFTHYCPVIHLCQLILSRPPCVVYQLKKTLVLYDKRLLWGKVQLLGGLLIVSLVQEFCECFASKGKKDCWWAEAVVVQFITKIYGNVLEICFL